MEGILHQGRTDRIYSLAKGSGLGRSTVEALARLSRQSAVDTDESGVSVFGTSLPKAYSKPLSPRVQRPKQR